MIRNIKKISLFLACMVLLLHAVVPHHHHNNTVCLSKLSHKECHDENSCCHTHSGANHDHSNNCEESDCIIDDLFTAKDNQEVKIYLDVNVLFSYYNIISSVRNSLENILKKGVEFRRNFVHLIYHNPHVSSIFGLRAPPV